TQQVGRDGLSSGGERTEPNKKGNVALESTGKRQVDRAVRLFVRKKIVSGYRHDPDYLDRLVLLLFFAGILDALSKCVTVRPKLLGQRLVNDCHTWTRLCCFRLGKRATTQHRQSNG